MTAVTVSYRVNHFFFIFKISAFSQIFNNKFSCSIRLKTSVFFRNIVVHSSVRIKKVDYFEVMALSNFPVVRVVSRGNLNHTSSKFFINIRIRNNRNFLVNQRQKNFFTNQVLIALIIRIYSNSRIAKESFRTSCSNFNSSRTVGIVVINVIHCALSILMLNFIISQSRATARTPVYKILAFIHKSAFIQCNKNITNSFRKSFIISKTLTAPVNRVSKFFLLFNDNVVVLVSNFPGSLSKSLASKVIAVFALFFKLLFNNILSGNSGMVGSRNPKSIITLHSMITNNNVLQGIIKTVSHMQNTCNVRRRNYDSIFYIGSFLRMNRRIFIACRFKTAFFNPFIINSVFKIFWIISFFKFNSFHFSSILK